MKWKRALRDLVFGKGKAEPRDFEQWSCPLEDDIWERWLLEAGDPEKSIGPWARQGVPLGISKQDGTVRRRIIVDLRRSGANSKSVFPERIILQRISDAIQDLRQLAEDEPQAWQQAAAVEDNLDTGLRGGVRRLLGRLHALESGPTRAPTLLHGALRRRLADPVGVPLLRLKGVADALGQTFSGGREDATGSYFGTVLSISGIFG